MRTARAPAPSPAPRGTSLLVALALSQVACQSYPTGVATICDAPRTCGARCNDAPLHERTRHYVAHLQGTLRNDEARAFFDSLADQDSAERARLLRAEAERAGVANCSLANHFDAESRSAPEP